MFQDLSERLNNYRNGHTMETEQPTPQVAMSRQIFVKMVSGKYITLDVKLSETVGDVKSKIYVKEGRSGGEKSLPWNKRLS